MAFRIDCLDDAIEAVNQYSDLGLPLPADLLAYLESQGFIINEPDGQPIENVEDIYE